MSWNIFDTSVYTACILLASALFCIGNDAEVEKWITKNKTTQHKTESTAH